MADFPIGLREVVPDQTVPEKCREFTIQTGGAQSTLQDIKVPDGAGGYVYKQSKSNDWTRNRFLEWRTSQDYLELVETSLDWDLSGSRIRFRFQDTPLLSGGVSVHETLHHVVILVATVGSVHKLVLPHPARQQKQELEAAVSSSSLQGGDATIPSIFFEASALTPRQHFHVLPIAGTAPFPHTAATWLDADDEALFALGNPAGNVMLIKLGNMVGMVTTNTLKSSSYFYERLWGNFGGMLSRGGATGGGGTTGDGSSAESVVSIVIHPIQNDVYVFALCKDHKIRMWLASSGDCVMVCDVLKTSLAMAGERSADGAFGPLQQGAQSHTMRKVSDGDVRCKSVGGGGATSPSNFALAVFLCFSQRSQFCLFRPVRADGQWKLDHLATVFSPNYDLIDFSVTPTGHLTALWTNPDGLPVLRFTHLGSSSGARILPLESAAVRWTNISLEEPLDPDFQPTSGRVRVDPRQAYLQQLFYPGRFSIQTLAKTVSIYRRSTTDLSALENVTVAKLKEEVCSAVEVEIHNQVTEFEISDEEHIELSHAAWERFYSCAIQYHEAGLKPMGLVADGDAGLLAVIKKSGHSFVRPVDALEQLVLTRGVGVHGQDLFQDTPVVCDDPQLANDVINLVRAIVLIDRLVTAQLADDFEGGLHQLVGPDHLAEQMATVILTSSKLDGDGVGFDDVQLELDATLRQIGDLARALEVMLMSLELDRGIVTHSDINMDKLDASDVARRLFASNAGVSVLAESLKQLANVRFKLTRNLILLQMIILQSKHAERMPASVSSSVHATFLPRSVVMVHCYFVLKWLTETSSTVPPANSLEQGLRQMVVLKISEQKGSENVAQLARTSPRPLTLSELFLRGPGRKARGLLTVYELDDRVSSWHRVLTPLVNICAQLLWPRCAVPVFQQFLMSTCQHTQIQEYVRLLRTWCDWNTHSRQFLLASALLNTGEPEKACDWMIQAAGGVASDRFLSMQIFSQREELENKDDPNRLTVLFFLKVINLFEQFGYFDCVVELARTAVGLCAEDDKDKTTLCYILFSYHLKLDHNDEAYDSMVSNPDPSRRKDSLRQFVVTLFERKQLRQLAGYPYVDMFDDLEAIIESRARSVDLTVNNYYDFLYSFHVTKENYRKAAHVMYECGMRLGVELFTLDGLNRQARCYLACLNCLKLVSRKNAWIVRPVLRRSGDDAASTRRSPFEASPKRDFDGEELMEETTLGSGGAERRMEVLEMEEIERDFQIVCARLKLANKRRRADRHTTGVLVGPGLSAAETVALLVASNLYEDAVKIASAHRPKLDFRPIVEALTSKCVSLSRSVGKSDDAWEWLAENNPSGSDVRSGTAVEAAWKLLRSIVSRLEGNGSKDTGLHRAVASKLISVGAFLPSWLVTSYKKRNAAELMRLYLNNGYLEDATTVTCEYIAAVLGDGKEYFDLPNSIHSHSAPVWLPHNTIDQILLELRDHLDDPGYSKLHHQLNDILKKYLSVAARVSQDMVEAKNRMNA